LKNENLKPRKMGEIGFVLALNWVCFCGAIRANILRNFFLKKSLRSFFAFCELALNWV